MPTFKQRVLAAEHNDRTKPFHLEAGKIEDDGQGGDYRNYKVIDSFATLDELQAEADKCNGYHFVDMLYVDNAGNFWEISLDPVNIRD